MPVTIDKAQVRPSWASKGGWRPQKAPGLRHARNSCISIALINNMPDAALEETELQFSSLIELAAGDVPVRMKFYSLASIVRTGRARDRVANEYFGLDDLWNSRFDGVIITGTEPRQSDLRKEPYWSDLAKTFDWAETNSKSVVLSCLAAHAGVLHSDGIERQPLSDKRFGLFEERRVCEHALVRGTEDVMRFPHSRWNEVRSDQLSAAGYTVLTASLEAGVNLFLKMKRESLFVHFQGHPEYSAQTLLKEYRRDVGRFLRKERETYPNTPQGYFSAEATKLLNEFREHATKIGSADAMKSFPDEAIAKQLASPWREAAVHIYRNWLHYVASMRRADSVASGLAARVASA